MQPNAPANAIMSPKKGSIAATVVAATTDNDRKTSRGTMFRAENSGFVGSANFLSITTFVGCRYTYVTIHFIIMVSRCIKIHACMHVSITYIISCKFNLEILLKRRLRFGQEWRYRLWGETIWGVRAFHQRWNSRESTVQIGSQMPNTQKSLHWKKWRSRRNSTPIIPWTFCLLPVEQ